MKRSVDRKRGRHKKAVSLETRLWNTQYLVPPPPPWMDTATWRRLIEMRTAL